MAEALRIVVLEGDQTGQELLEQACRVLDPEVVDMELDLDRRDLSLEHRPIPRVTDYGLTVAPA